MSVLSDVICESILFSFPLKLALAHQTRHASHCRACCFVRKSCTPAAQDERTHFGRCLLARHELMSLAEVPGPNTPMFYWGVF